MPNNCIQTKLKSTVNNTSLSKLGVMRIVIPNTTPTSVSFKSSNIGCILKVVTGTVYTDSSYTTVAAEERNIGTSSATKSFTNGQGGQAVLEIVNKYNLGAITITSGVLDIEFKDFFGLQYLAGLFVNFQLIVSDGHLEDLISTNYREVVSDSLIPKFKLSNVNGSNVTFNNAFGGVTLDLSDTSLIKVYREIIDSFDEATLAGIYNRSTGEWTYNS